MRFKFIFLVAFVFITVSVSGCATPAPRGELQEALASFEKRVARADQAIFFYAGHSLQISGAITRLAAAPGQIAVLLDASRDNPLAIVYHRTSRGRETEDLHIGLGLAEVPAVDGTYVAFSTAPGHVAFNGTAGHSPCGKAILNPMDLKI